jgi:hypothetical protein
MPRRRPSRSAPRTESQEPVPRILDHVRTQLQEAGSTARSTAPSIHESYDFDSDRPDIGFLCELVAELLDSVASKLVVVSVLRARSPDIGAAVEDQRRRLRGVQAVLCAMTYFLRRTPRGKAIHLLVVYSLAANCEAALSALEPAALAVPASKVTK